MKTSRGGYTYLALFILVLPSLLLSGCATDAEWKTNWRRHVEPPIEIDNVILMPDVGTIEAWHPGYPGFTATLAFSISRALDNEEIGFEMAAPRLTNEAAIKIKGLSMKDTYLMRIRVVRTAVTSTGVESDFLVTLESSERKIITIRLTVVPAFDSSYQPSWNDLKTTNEMARAIIDSLKGAKLIP